MAPVRYYKTNATAYYPPIICYHTHFLSTIITEGLTLFNNGNLIKIPDPF